MARDARKDSGFSEVQELERTYCKVFGQAKRESITGRDDKSFEIFNLNPPKRMNYSVTTRVH